jgi:hypothetical protein
VEATIAGVRAIADICVKSRTVKRLIYTASVVATSPLNEDGSGYKSCTDESCWTPSDLSLTYANDYVLVFLLSYSELPHYETCSFIFLSFHEGIWHGSFFSKITNNLKSYWLFFSPFSIGIYKCKNISRERGFEL